MFSPLIRNTRLDANASVIFSEFFQRLKKILHLNTTPDCLHDNYALKRTLLFLIVFFTTDRITLYSRNGLPRGGVLNPTPPPPNRQAQYPIKSHQSSLSAFPLYVCMCACVYTYILHTYKNTKKNCVFILYFFFLPTDTL